MGWLDWIRETAQQVSTAIETGLRGVVELAEEIRPYLPFRPATEAQIEEAMEEAIYADRFIQEALPDEAIRLARGVQFYKKLTNVAQMRHWTVQEASEIAASNDYQISVRRVLAGPDGAMTYVDVSFPVGEKYTEDEMIRRAASALDDDFVSRYEIGRSDLIRMFSVHQESYIQRFKPF